MGENGLLALVYFVGVLIDNERASYLFFIRRVVVDRMVAFVVRRVFSPLWPGRSCRDGLRRDHWVVANLLS
jgi:hypothetical protein